MTIHSGVNHFFCGFSVAFLHRICFYSMAFVCIVAFFFCLNTLEKKYPHTAYENLSYLPSGKFLKGAVLSYDELVSDILWIRALGYFGDHCKTDKQYTFLSHILDVVTILDPLYQPPYEFGGIVLASEAGDVDASIALLKKGVAHVRRDHPRFYYFYFFLAFDYMYYKRDYLTAARYLEQAAKFPESPPYLPRLAARLYADADAPDAAIPFLKEMIQSTDRADLKAQLVERLHQVTHQANLKMLNFAINKYYIRFTEYPPSLTALVSSGIIDFIPVDPRGGTYYISSDHQSVENTIKTEALKVHIKNDKVPQQQDLPLPMRVPEYN